MQRQTPCLHQRLLSLSWIYVDHIFAETIVSPFSEFEQHMYSSDPRPDTGSSMQRDPYNCTTDFTASIIQSVSQKILILNSTTRRPRSEKPLETSGSVVFLFFHSKPRSCRPICGIIIANKSLSSANAALVFSFCPSRKNRRHLGCAILCAVEGAQCKARELP